MSEEPHITLEEALVKLQNAKSFIIYEYYDGYYLTIDNNKYIIYADIDDDIDAFYYLSLKVIPSIFEYLPDSNLTEFSCTSRFASELKYSEFQGIPDSLKILKLDHLEGIKIDLYKEQLKNIDIILSGSNDSYDDNDNPVTNLLNNYGIISRFDPNW